MGRRHRRRIDRDLAPPQRQEIVTYLLNAEPLAAMSSRFVANVTTRQLRRIERVEHGQSRREDRTAEA